MKSRWILDAHGLIQFLEHEPGYKKVKTIFRKVYKRKPSNGKTFQARMGERILEIE